MNDAWEDLIALTVIVLALAAYLMLLDAILVGKMMQDAAAEKYMRAQTTADLLAAEWSYGGDAGVLDPSRVCSNCPPGTAAAVYDLRKDQNVCSCGNVENATVARRPTTIRYDYCDVAPALIEVRLT